MKGKRPLGAAMPSVGPKPPPDIPSQGLQPLLQSSILMVRSLLKLTNLELG
jgi:hypothetical protein